MIRDEFDRATGRKSRRGKIEIAGTPFMTSSGIEAIVWHVPNRASLGSTGPAFVSVSLLRIPSLERPVTA